MCFISSVKPAFLTKNMFFFFFFVLFCFFVLSFFCPVYWVSLCAHAVISIEHLVFLLIL